MKYCITFAGGDKSYYDAAIRLMNQASDIGLFDKNIYIQQNIYKMIQSFGVDMQLLWKIIKKDTDIGYGNPI
jgi:hypothetical protein